MSSKFKIVLSDLHMGAGFKAQGNALEDFDKDADLAAFVDDIAVEADQLGSEVELIFAGDAFEMLQVPHTVTFDPATSYAPEQYHSSSELDSARKMDHIIAGHLTVFDALNRFLRPRQGGDQAKSPPSRRVTFVKGNHDLILHWPAVQERIRQALSATGDGAGWVSFEERCISREGIYVEHGNQYAEEVSRVPDMDWPLDGNDPSQLALPVGSWFVMDFLNEVERQKYWVDGVKPIVSLIAYALVYDFAFAARSLSALFRALPGVVDRGILVARNPRADLVRQLENPERAAEIGARYGSDAAFRAWFDAEVERLLQVAGSSAESFTASAGAEAFAEQVRLQVGSELTAAAQRCAAGAGARVVVFGHTHQAGLELLPDDVTYANCGTWTWWCDFSGAAKETWRDLFAHPDWFSGDLQLSYVRIDYDASARPSARLLTYMPGGASTGSQRRLSPWKRLLAWFGALWKRIGKRS